MHLPCNSQIVFSHSQIWIHLREYFLVDLIGSDTSSTPLRNPLYPNLYMLKDYGADCYTVFDTVGMIIHPILVTVRPTYFKHGHATKKTKTLDISVVSVVPCRTRLVGIATENGFGSRMSEVQILSPRPKSQLMPRHSPPTSWLFSIGKIFMLKGFNIG